MTTASTDVSTMSGPGRQLALEDRLHRLWTRQTWLLALRGSCWIVSALVGLVLADLLVDWQLDLAGWLRMALLAANIAALVYVTRRELLRHVKGYDAVDLALQVERTWPDLGGLLVSSVQFGRLLATRLSSPKSEVGDDGPGQARGVSAELMRAVQRQAASRTASMDLDRARLHAAVRRPLAVALAAVLLLVGVGVLRGDFLWVLCCRMVNPACQLAYPTRTTIDVLSGDQTVRWTEKVSLLAQAGGREIPTEGKVYVRSKGGGWESVAASAPDGSPPGRFEYVLPRVTENLDYYFRMGDAKSPSYRITVVRPPQIVDARVDLEYPQYISKAAPQGLKTLNLKAPEGTMLTWRLTFDRPVLLAQMNLEGAKPQVMTLGSDGRSAELRRPADASRSYRIDLHWRLATQTYVEPGATHYIQVVPDADPQVGLVQPAEDAKATLRKTVNLAFWASDDNGLADANIVYGLNDGGEMRYPLGSLAKSRPDQTPASRGEPGQTSVQREAAWPITKVLAGLKANDMVTFAVEVTDARPGTPGRARSVSRRVQFVSDNEYISYILARQRKLLAQLRPLYLQEREAGSRLASLKGGAVGAAGSNFISKSSGSADAAEIAALAALEATRQDMVGAQLDDLIGRFNDLIGDLASNKDIGVDVSRSARTLTDRLSTVRQVRVGYARKLIDEAMRKPAVASQRLTEARSPVELAARELGSLLLQAGVSQACEVFATELREIITGQESLQRAAIESTTRPDSAMPPNCAPAQRELADRVDRLLTDITAMLDSPTDALAAVRLARARKIVQGGQLVDQMRQAAALLEGAGTRGHGDTGTKKENPPAVVSASPRPGVSASSSSQPAAMVADCQGKAIKGLRQGLMKLRPDARLAELVRARNLLSESLTAQKMLRTRLTAEGGDPGVLGRGGLDAFKLRQEALARPLRQLDSSLDIDAHLASADKAFREASNAFLSADPVNQVVAAQVQAESALASAIDKLANQVAAIAALGDTHRRMLESAERFKALTEIGQQSEQIKSSAYEAATAGKSMDGVAAALLQHSKSIEAFAAAAPADSKFAAACRRPLTKAAQAIARSAAEFKSGRKGSFDAGMAELVKAEQSHKEALEITRRELGVLEKLWLFRQASADVKLVRHAIQDIEGEQSDLRADVDSAYSQHRTVLDLTGPQALLGRAVSQVQENVAAIREASGMKEPLDAALAAMNQAAGELEKDQATPALDSQAKALAALKDSDKAASALITRIDLIVVEIDAASELSSRAMGLLQRQITLRETTEDVPEADFAKEASRLAGEQDILFGETEVMSTLSVAPKAAAAFKLAATEMTAAITELKAVRRDGAVEHMKKAEDALRTGILALDEYILSLLTILQSPHSIVEKYLTALDGMTAILLLATEQRELRDMTVRAPDPVLPTYVDKQTELHDRAIVVSNMPNVLTLEGRITGWEHIESAAKAMTKTVDALKKPVRNEAVPQQQLAEKELRIAFAMNVVELITALSPPDPNAPTDPEVIKELKDKPVPVSLDHWVEFSKADPSGKQPPSGGKSEWSSLVDRERAALNENFARELPLEFRKLLKDYYEALSK